MTQHHHKHATLTHAGPGKPATLSNAAVADSDHDGKLAFLNDIRLSAYQKWEAAGKPNGDGVQFWLEAEQELVEGTKEKFVQGDGWRGDRELESAGGRGESQGRQCERGQPLQRQQQDVPEPR